MRCRWCGARLIWQRHLLTLEQELVKQAAWWKANKESYENE